MLIKETIQDKIVRGLRFITTPKAFFISIMLGIVLIISSPIILMTYVFWDFDASSDAPVIMNIQISPKKTFTARQYTVSGGGAAGYTSQYINIQHTENEFDKSKGIIFQSSQSKIISLNWKDQNTLIVEYVKIGKVFLRNEIIENQINVNVQFIEK